MMSLDLITLLVVRVGVDMLIAVAFFATARRYPAIGGPGWWALGSVASMAGVMGMAVVPAAQHAAGQLLSGTLVFLSSLSVWLGLRAYLGMPLAWLRCAVATLAVAGLDAAGEFWFDRAGLSLGVLAAGGMLVTGWSMHDIRAAQQARRQPELSALVALLAVEWLILAGMLAAVLWPTLPSIDPWVPAFLAAFLMTKMARAVIYGTLVSLRLGKEARAARRAVEVREVQLRALVDNLGAGILLLQADRRILDANAAARRFLGLGDGSGALAGVHVADWALLREDGSPMPLSERPIERVLAHGRAVDEIVMGIRTRPSDPVLWALCNAYPESDRLGTYVLFSFVDITPLRQAQQQQKLLAEQLAQSQKMDALGTLAGGIAHDFNNILAAILGNADLARQDLAPGTPARESLHEISHAARRGRELVRQILTFSRQQPMERVAMRLCDIVQETSALLRTALTPQIQLVMRPCDGLPLLRADPTQIGQVLLNLSTNAIHAMQGGPGRLELRVAEVAADDPLLPPEVARICRQEGVSAVSLAVADTGCGMDEATRRRVFDPFFTTKPVGQGTGLGLPVVLGIVESHGGAIRVDTAPGQGSTFTLYFPGEPSGTVPVLPDACTMSPDAARGADSPITASEETPSMSAPPAKATGHVLYLDDDDTLVFLVRRLLVRRGCEVTALCDQREAIEAVRATPDRFDLLLTDYNMPGMSGIDVAREVLAINPKLAVAVASGYINEDLERAAAAAGVREVVFKTDAIESFCEVVERLVNASPSRR